MDHTGDDGRRSLELEALEERSRASLIEELRLIEQTRRGYTREQLRRIYQICSIINKCTCRHCGKVYNEVKARGDLKGFCSAKCQHAKSRALGYRKSTKVSVKVRSEYDVLKSAGEVGSVFVVK